MFSMESQDVRTGLVFAAALLLYYWATPKRGSNFPPGPMAFPVVGNIPQLKTCSDFFESLYEMSKQYGDLFSVFLGTRRAIVLTNYEMIREAFVKHGHAFHGRPQSIFYKGRGLFANGETWYHQRKFANKLFKDFKIWDHSFQEKILEEVGEAIKVLKGHCDEPYDPLPLLKNCTGKIICSVIMGKRYDYDDPEFLKLVNSMKVIGESIPVSRVAAVFPLLRYVLNFSKPRAAMEEALEVHRRQIREHEETMESTKDQFPRDFADVYIHAGRELKREGKEDDLGGENLAEVMRELMSTGVETTAASLAYCFIYMAQRPEIQRKVQHEIDAVIGRTRQPVMDDRLRMPYTHACIMETLRFEFKNDIGICRLVMEDVTFRGYHIPKDTWVIPLAGAIYRDPQLWEKPEEFYPEHFLNADGSYNKRPELITFSIGRRSCMAEPLAKMELFLFFTSLLQNFTLSLEKNNTQTFDKNAGQINMPKPFTLLIRCRDSEGQGQQGG